MASLATTALAIFAVLYVIDYFFTGGPTAKGGPAQYFYFDQDHITDAVSGLGSMVAGVLGIVISVVAIVQQGSGKGRRVCHRRSPRPRADRRDWRATSAISLDVGR